MNYEWLQSLKPGDKVFIYYGGRRKTASVAKVTSGHVYAGGYVFRKHDGWSIGKFVLMRPIIQQLNPLDSQASGSGRHPGDREREGDGAMNPFKIDDLVEFRDEEGDNALANTLALRSMTWPRKVVAIDEGYVTAEGSQWKSWYTNFRLAPADQLGTQDTSDDSRPEPIYWRCRWETGAQRNGWADYRCVDGPTIEISYDSRPEWFVTHANLSDMDAEFERCNADGTPLDHVADAGKMAEPDRLAALEQRVAALELMAPEPQQTESEEPQDDAPKCKSCGVPWREHLGPESQCAELQKAKERMPCGHLRSSIVTSIESGLSWCGECDMQSRLSDAVQMERHNSEQWEAEKKRRVYYQDIVYAVCDQIDRELGHTPGQGVVCGTLHAPSTMVQDSLKEVIHSLRVQVDNERQFFSVNQHTIEQQQAEIDRLNLELTDLHRERAAESKEREALAQQLTDVMKKRDELQTTSNRLLNTSLNGYTTSSLAEQKYRAVEHERDQLRDKIADVTKERDETRNRLMTLQTTSDLDKAGWEADHNTLVNVRRQLEEVKKERDALRSADNPEWDATDAAHPAWWRGHDHTAKVFCQLVNEILNGKDVSAGLSGEPWQTTKMRIAQLRDKLAESEAVVAELREAFVNFRSLGGDYSGDSPEFFVRFHDKHSTMRASSIFEKFIVGTAGRDLLDRLALAETKSAKLDELLGKLRKFTNESVCPVKDNLAPGFVSGACDGWGRARIHIGKLLIAIRGGKDGE